MGPRSSVSAAVMPSMDGIRKLLLPKMTRQISETPSPTSAAVLAGAPLLHHDHKEQRGHRKVDACGIKGDDAAQQRAGHAARHPINLVEQRSKQIVTVSVHALGTLLLHTTEYVSSERAKIRYGFAAPVFL